jgi:hypothetical protein
MALREGGHCHNNGRRSRSGRVSNRDSDPEIIPRDHIPTSIATPPTFFYPLRKILIGPCMASWAVQGTTLHLLYECVNLGFWHRVKIEGTQFCFSAGGRIWARHAWHLGCSADSEMVYRFSFFIVN